MSSKSPRGLVLKLLVSYYSAPSTQAPQPWCSPIREGMTISAQSAVATATRPGHHSDGGRSTVGSCAALEWSCAFGSVHRGVCTRVSSLSAHGSTKGQTPPPPQQQQRQGVHSGIGGFTSLLFDDLSSQTSGGPSTSGYIGPDAAAQTSGQSTIRAI